MQIPKKTSEVGLWRCHGLQDAPAAATVATRNPQKSIGARNMPHPASSAPPPRWAASRDRVIYGVNHMARRAVRDVFRETRHELRTAHLPVDPWIDGCIAGRGGNHTADMMTRFAHLLEVAGRTPCQVRERLVLIAHRVADALHHKTTPTRALQSAVGTVNPHRREG